MQDERDISGAVERILDNDCDGGARVSQDTVRALVGLVVGERERDRWEPIESAPKDGSYILAIVAPNRGRHLEHQAGRVFAIRYEGTTTPSGYDMGWAVYPGLGGASDFDFSAWHPLPPISSFGGR